MATLLETLTALDDLAASLSASSSREIDPPVVAERIRQIRRALSPEDVRWIGTAEAKELLDVESEHTVDAWARLGLLRSRTLSNGCLQVLLSDVLYRREERADLTAIGGEDLTPEELRILKAERPEKNPWEREQAARSG